ncbi:hypothetical protein CIMG_03175 [Paecilomyces variotii No. 5]|uniref:Rhamnogalacturonase A/B/Epimerase-like pectate lyase domain-containing protein n=1 Tax=Byssochlamys spectabilis (strain No. 5 / NBRC 109023) TaxID=1356009 RepID=V5G9W0_BYSSN|nr:hypothetical protein CIMG_03175 [Paecilomyces variotii No. 5]
MCEKQSGLQGLSSLISKHKSLLGGRRLLIAPSDSNSHDIAENVTEARGCNENIGSVNRAEILQYLIPKAEDKYGHRYANFIRENDVKSLLESNLTPGCSASPVVKSRSQAKVPISQIPKELLDSQGNVFERTQYENVPISSFISVKSAGAKGDGNTNDMDAIQKVLDSATEDQIVYFDHGNYVITFILKVPRNIKITGEIRFCIFPGFGNVPLAYN